jgi:sugar phosphate isomerase/epimerase
MTRRAILTAMAALVPAAGKLPANRNVRWALGSSLWNYFPPVPFTDILDVMRDTGFIGIRVTQFPQILTRYHMTAADLEREVSKRNLHVITISFNGAAHDGEIDFPGCHRVLKSLAYKGWICVDLDTARKGPRVSYERCGAYVEDRLEPIYA